jgi:hypothetical protein
VAVPGGSCAAHAAYLVESPRCGTSVPTPTLPYVVLVAWLGACVPASWLGHSRKLAVFWIAGVSTLGGGTTYRVRLGIGYRLFISDIGYRIIGLIGITDSPFQNNRLYR